MQNKNKKRQIAIHCLKKIGLISSLIFIGIKQNQKSSNAQHITMMNRNKYAQVQNLLIRHKQNYRTNEMGVLSSIQKV